MAQINFLKEVMAFHRYAISNAVTGNERHLWWALFFLFNERAVGKAWPDDFVSFSNKQLLAHLPYSEDSLDLARKNLAKRGIIAYKPGRKNKLCPQYQMRYFFAEPDASGQPVENVPQFTGNIGGNMPDNVPGSASGKMLGNVVPYPSGNLGGNIQDIPLNLNYTQDKYIHTFSGYDDAWRTSASARGAVAQRIIDKWEGDPSGGFDMHGAIVYYLEQEMTPDTIERVLANCSAACYADAHLETEAVCLGLIPDPCVQNL